MRSVRPAKLTIRRAAILTRQNNLLSAGMRPADEESVRENFLGRENGDHHALSLRAIFVNPRSSFSRWIER
jgi:hypothetical protein